MKVKLESPNGIIKEVKVGFSWTSFFFGFFVPLFRGDMKWAAIFFFAGLAISIIFVFAAPLLWIFMGVSYNKLYLTDLVEKGYTGFTEEDERVLKQAVA